MTNLILVYLLIGLILSIVFAVFIGKIGSRKEIGGNTALLLSLFLSPLLGLVIVLASEDLKDGERRPINAGFLPGFIAFVVVVLGIFFIVKGQTERALAPLNAISQNNNDTTIENNTAAEEEPSRPIRIYQSGPESALGGIFNAEIETGLPISRHSIDALLESGRWEAQPGTPPGIEVAATMYLDKKDNTLYIIEDLTGEILFTAPE